MDAWRALSEDLQRLQQRLTGLIASLTDGPTTLTTYVPDMDAVAARVMARLGTSPDVIVRRFRIGGSRAGLVCYFDNLVDVSIIDRDILRPVLQGADPVQDGLPVSHASATQDWETLITGILAGQTAVCLEDLPEVWLVDTVKLPQRSIERPQTEMAIRGPQEAFNEVLAT
ncbi:spore germination protein [Sulfobacillus sp. DSM 109850]|uniref:Spore germination protein n=1 Tax=Sulfobacillus harzensis TaxID=2729629 RepID=A0A7Y0Q264_9FIRM|nr:spore germination protein [Sulfobacillus harzensis]